MIAVSNYTTYYQSPVGLLRITGTEQTINELIFYDVVEKDPPVPSSTLPSLLLQCVEELIEYFTLIKGVGRWTAEMLLMFALGREDVFAVDDLGIQNVMAAIYKLNKVDKKQLKLEMLRISEKWIPYRTYACLHLWHWKDNSPATT